MSKASEERKQRLRSAAQRRTAEDAPASGSTAVRSKPVRITIDLSPAQYQQLKIWTLHAAADVGANVAVVDVIRTLASYLDQDPEIAERVLADLREAKNV